jgi:cyclic pyranopterin phosphate synthase
MWEEMTFLPRKALLAFEELEQIARCFIDYGVEKIRATGGEPLVRKDILALLWRFQWSCVRICRRQCGRR